MFVVKGLNLHLVTDGVVAELRYSGLSQHSRAQQPHRCRLGGGLRGSPSGLRGGPTQQQFLHRRHQVATGLNLHLVTNGVVAELRSSNPGIEGFVCGLPGSSSCWSLESAPPLPLVFAAHPIRTLVPFSFLPKHAARYQTRDFFTSSQTAS